MDRLDRMAQEAKAYGDFITSFTGGRIGWAREGQPLTVFGQPVVEVDHIDGPDIVLGEA